LEEAMTVKNKNNYEMEFTNKPNIFLYNFNKFYKKICIVFLIVFFSIVAIASCTSSDNPNIKTKSTPVNKIQLSNIDFIDEERYFSINLSQYVSSNLNPRNKSGYEKSSRSEYFEKQYELLQDLSLYSKVHTSYSNKLFFKGMLDSLMNKHTLTEKDISEFIIQHNRHNQMTKRIKKLVLSKLNSEKMIKTVESYIVDDHLITEKELEKFLLTSFSKSS
jgi:hypothetical protein